jgi:hypothetical protein
VSAQTAKQNKPVVHVEHAESTAQVDAVLEQNVGHLLQNGLLPSVGNSFDVLSRLVFDFECLDKFLVIHSTTVVNIDPLHQFVQIFLAAETSG